MAEPFVHRLRARYSDCDPQGVVFNANYLTYLDDAMVALFRETVGGYRALTASGVDYVVAEAQLRFLAAARYDDELEVTIAVTRMGTTGMSTAHAIRDAGDGRTLTEATMRYVWIDAHGAGKTPIPDQLRAAFAPYVVSDAA